jgi:hypothetical protein
MIIIILQKLTIHIYLKNKIPSFSPNYFTIHLFSEAFIELHLQ